MIAPQGTEIYAVDDGEVIDWSDKLYHGTGAIALAHRGFVARYCEVMPSSIAHVKLGQRFKAGDVIARVGKMYSSAMLHFELYAGTAYGSLSNKRRPPFCRRADLLDPTKFLDGLKSTIRVGRGPIKVDVQAWKAA